MDGGTRKEKPAVKRKTEKVETKERDRKTLKMHYKRHGQVERGRWRGVTVPKGKGEAPY